LLALALFAGSALAETKAEQDARMAWWRDARFGMFIHWGLYAVPAGLKCEIYNGDWDTVPDFDALKPTATKTVATIASHSGESAEHCGCRLTGFIVVPRDDVYLFALSSDDGSRITIAGKRVVDNDGLHGAEAKTGTIALAMGLHPISIEYFNKPRWGRRDCTAWCLLDVRLSCLTCVHDKRNRGQRNDQVTQCRQDGFDHMHRPGLACKLAIQARRASAGSAESRCASLTFASC
jgi:hypothetical protein